jgi:hypothetical protein
MPDGSRDEPESTSREETAGVEPFEREFEWTPEERPSRLPAAVPDRAKYAVLAVIAIAVLAVVLPNVAPLAGSVSAPTAPDVDLDSVVPDVGGPGGSDGGTTTPTAAATATPTASQNPSATPTGSPAPAPVATATPTRAATPADTPTPTFEQFTPDRDKPIPTPSPTPTPTATPPNFEVTIDSTNSPITEGGTLEVTAMIENTGGSRGEQQVVMTIEGSQEDSKTVTLGPGESTQETFTWSTSSGDAGEYTATVVGDNETGSDSKTVSVRKPPEVTDFTITDQSDCPPAVEDNVSFDVSWETKNADSVTVSWSGGSKTANKGDSPTRFNDPDGECGNDYEFKIVAKNDADRDTQTKTRTAGS